MSKSLSCSLAAIFALSIAVISPKVGPFSVDAVSAATTAAPATPSKPYTPSKTTTPSKSTTSVNYAPATSVTRLLRFNSMGGDVKLLQTTLNTKGYKLDVDGILGKLTLAAVKDYQGKNGLAVDGLVGPATLAKLNAKPVTPPAVKPPVVKPPVVVPPVVVPPVVVPPVDVPPVDVVTSASLVSDAAVFEKSIGKDGKWIIATTKDLTSTKDLVLEGEFKNGKKDTVTGADLIQRKIGLYTQDDKRNVTARFTLTAPKLTINSPMASLEHGTFKGDLYVSSANFKLIDQKVDGNVYFTTQIAKDTFNQDTKSVVTGTKELIEVDAVTSPSLVKDVAAFENAISPKGNWIASVSKDLTTTKELVLDGDKMNTKTPPVSMRKIALYSQDDKHVTTRKFTLTAPKLTIKSVDANISKGIFVGDIYVSAKNFQLIDAKVDGNVYFTTQEAKDTFKMDATSSVTGGKELIEVDAVTSPSLVKDVAAFENAISPKGNWIASVSKDLTTTKELVLDGDKMNTKTPPVSMRKIALYSQDDKYNVTRRFTLTAPKLTIKSVDANISKGIFVGDIYVSAKNFQLIDTSVVGNVYFTNKEAQDTFVKDAKSSISGLQALKLN
ncbi:peptidoglycan-binding protein [Clostridium sp. CS001]|uniref:peptidoglycan-binding domain-containing protein n=1 Tax=Clostridium sp. CS001 TaxID=2880648 RepID=UPI001CF1C9FB|nr:peptidoglycan-binding domain-containing protein [Clostridium sp. CS001]MCB2289263.1 peptidoglycan-binding protein [Clostridium sp. CS001]